MSFLLPRVAFGPASCAPAGNNFAPLLSLLDDSLSQIDRASRRHQPRQQFSPRFDVKEIKEAYQLEGELPGIEQKDIQIEFTDEHTLTIRGRTERHNESGTPLTASIQSTEKPAIEDAAVPASNTSSDKSHQPTVEDEEAPANASPAAETIEVAAPAPTKETAKAEKPKHRYWVSERTAGSFHRSFTFPARVDQDAVKASLKNGILSVLVPKAAALESRRINIE